MENFKYQTENIKITKNIDNQYVKPDEEGYEVGGFCCKKVFRWSIAQTDVRLIYQITSS